MKRLIPLLSLLFVESLIFVSVAEAPLLSTAGGEFAVVRKPFLPPDPNLQAQAYLIKILGEEKPLLARREWKPLPPASITKLLTAVLAKEVLTEKKVITFSETAKATEEKMTSLPAGTELRRDDALRLALIISANDAARALAEEIGRKWGGDTLEERLFIFTALANEKAHALGLDQTRIENPTGLDEDKHLASAEDLARLAEYIWRVHPDLWEITRSIETEIALGDNESSTFPRGIEPRGKVLDKKYKAVNTNKLLKEFPAILGGKTGFTDNAKETLILLYPLKSGKTAVAVILGSEDRFGDGRKIIEWLENIQ